MLSDLIPAVLAAALVGVVPGYFWARVLFPGADLAQRVTFSVALSITLVPTAAFAQARLFGTGVTLAITLAAVLLVLGSGLLAYRRFGPGKAPGAPLAQPPAPPGPLTLVPLIVAAALAAAVVADLLPAESLILPVGALILLAGAAYLLSPRNEPEASGGDRFPLTGVLLPLVLALVLVRGYAGPVAHDWPFIRGLDHYSHAVMANELLATGSYEHYLVYPPGFHLMTAMVSRLSGLDPLEVFPVLAPALLVLPVLALYTLARQLWGRECGLVAAAGAGLIFNGSFEYLSDGMYPNLVGAQFLLVVAATALVRLYAAPSLRSGAAFALLGAAVVFYHPVASLYTALLLALVGVALIPYLLLRDRRRGVALTLAFAGLGGLALLFAWDTYDPLPAILGLLGGSPEGATGSAVTGAIGTQMPHDLERLLRTTSHPVFWLGLLGVLFLLARQPTGEAQHLPYSLVRATFLIWAALMFAGSRTALSGFPERFERDLGVPLALLAAVAVVSLARSLPRRRPTAKLGLPVVAAAVLSVAVLGGVQLERNLERAGEPDSNLLMTPGIAAAGEWLEENNTGGQIIVAPHMNQVPGRAMLAMGEYSGLESFTAHRIELARDLPPYGPEPLKDVLYVVRNPADGRTQEILTEYDVRYVIFYREFDPESAWTRRPPLRPGPFKEHPELYRVAFENDAVIIFEPR